MNGDCVCWRSVHDKFGRMFSSIRPVLKGNGLGWDGPLIIEATRG